LGKANNGRRYEKEISVTAVNRTSHGGHTSVVEHNGVLYLGGIAANDLTLPVEDQTRQCLAEVDRVLAEAGSSKASILFARVNLSKYTDKDAMHRAWLAWLGDTGLPARSTNGGLDLGDALVEVVVIAAKES